MEVFHDPTLPVARSADDGMGHGDHRPVDGIDQLDNRLAVMVAKDPVFVLKDHDIAACQVAGCGTDAHRAVWIDLHPDLPRGRGRGTPVDETHEVYVEFGS